MERKRYRFSPEERSLHKAIFAALGIGRKGLTQVFEDIASRSSYYSLSYRTAGWLRELACLVRESLQDEDITVKIPLPRKGQLLPEDFWNRLGALVQIADETLSEGQKRSLVDQLGGFYSSGYKDLLKSLKTPTDELLKSVEQYVCPIVDRGEGRPRNNLAQRRLRFKNDTKHQFDVGHFLPHSAGGPPDINLFVQERRLNRGWSAQGKRYRWIENMVLSNPGTFFFVRPVYGDLSSIPVYLEWGALLDEKLLGKVVKDMDQMPDLHLVRPLDGKPSDLNLTWVISVFENFTLDAIREMRVSAGWTDGL